MTFLLPHRLFTDSLLKVDDWIRVDSCNNQAVFGRAWPQQPNAVQLEEMDLQPSLVLPASCVWIPKKPVVVVLSVKGGTRLEEGQCRIGQITYSRAIRVSLKITALDTEHDVEVFGFKFGKAKRIVQRKMISSLLSGIVFICGSVIHLLDGALQIQILETDSIENCYQFTPQTIINLIDDSNTNAPPPTTSPIVDRQATIPIPSGLTAAFQSLYDIVKLPLVHSHLVQQLNIEYPKGVLLYGPPGVGKTMLVTTVAKYCSADLFTINGSDVFGSHLGESEEHIRNKFNEALGVARSQANRRACILFIDEIDAIAPNRNESSQSDSRMVATLLTLMDGMKSHSDRLIVLAATNRPNAIDPALRRPGRFDREIAFEAPNESARYDILKSMAKGIGSVDADVDFKALAISTNGYVGADLAALSREAVVRCLESGSGRCVSNADFLYALSITTPSTTRGYGVGVPAGLTWDSVGGLEDVKLKLRQCVEWPIIHRETFRRLGLKPPRGVLLYGPPGCSKTTLVKIIASTSNATFLSINGASLYSPFVGDSEQSVRSLFHRARISAPSVIFLDEIDAIVGNRDLSGGGGGGGSRDATQESVLSTLLNEMDGIEAAKDVLVVGATNRPDMIDAALMRPGRFDKVVYVPPPDQTARREIFNLYTKGMPLSTSEGIDFESLADRTERYTGADLESVCREAAFSALRENKEAENFVEGRHFEDALKSVKPSLSEDMLRQYEGFRKKFGGAGRK